MVSRCDQAPKWMLLQYPLIEMDISRRQCLDIIEESPYPSVKKSGCYICPYAGLNEWATLKKNHPELLKGAVEFEEQYRKTRPERKSGLLGHDRKMWLKDFAAMGNLFDFIEDYDEPITSCDSKENGGCFL